MKTLADFGIHVQGIGEQKTTCPQCSASRKKKAYPCLNVNVEKGIWNCWHCGWSGTIKYGEQQRPEIRKVYTRPVLPLKGGSTSVVTWLGNRGVTPEVISRNGIASGTAYFPQIEEEKPCILFPYFRGGDVINIKYRTKDKLFRMAAGCEQILYGLDDVEETLIWVEGEIDKLSVEVAGFKSCVSVPNGAPAPDTKNYSSKFDFLNAPELEKVQKHIIAVDADAPGRTLEKELIRRLGAEKCWIVRWPDEIKDANEALQARGAVFLSELVSNPHQPPIIGSCVVSDYHDEFVELHQNGSQRGYSTGWAEVDELYTVREGDMTVVTGIPNSGKSEFIDALMVNMAANQGFSFGIFSAENWPITEHAKKLSEKFIGKPFAPGKSASINSTELDIAESWLSNHFYFVQPESPTIESILTVMRQLVLRHGIKGMIIDPWNEIEHSRPENQTETEYIGSVLSEIRRFARSYLLHAWIVAHPTKLRKEPDGNYPVPTPYDISGSANWRNKADNCISIWRNLSHGADNFVEIHIQKIRHKSVGKLGMAQLRYDYITGRYSGVNHNPAPYELLKVTPKGEAIISESF
jgi:twinkle protein